MRRPPPPFEPPVAEIDLGDVILRRWSPEDVDAAVTAVTESLDHLRRWMPWARDGYGPEEAQQFLDIVDAGWEQGTEFAYAMREADGTVVGSVGLHARLGPGGLEIGYWVHPGRTRRGLATRGARAMTEVAFSLPGATHVEIHHDEDNRVSGRIPARLGFRRLGVFERTAEDPEGPGREVRWRLDAPT